MVRKEGLQSELGTIDATVGGVSFGSTVRANMRRYIYKIKTVNQQAAANLLSFGHSTAGVGTILDYIDHATEHEIWNDPDELKEDALPIYILPAETRPWGSSLLAGPIYVYILYEDAP